jgi:Ca2+-binding EF-hand superfamily protein
MAMQNTNSTQKFTDDEINNLKEIFDLFDKEQQGKIDVKDLETIMSSLQRDPSEIREFIENIDPNHAGFISFDEFIDLMQ